VDTFIIYLGKEFHISSSDNLLVFDIKLKATENFWTAFMSLFYLQQEKNQLTKTFRTYHKTPFLDSKLISASVTPASEVGAYAMLMLLILGNLELRRFRGITGTCISFVSSVLKSVKWFIGLS
jgi:hypothetical protein